MDNIVFGCIPKTSYFCSKFGIGMSNDKYIQRDSYLNKLILRKDNGEVKIITGPRRCGKSWLLSHIYRDYLTAQGVPSENIIALDFDKDDDKYDFDIKPS